MCAVRSIAIFFAVMFFMLFMGCVVDASDGGAPRHILPVMLAAETACGLCIMIATAVKRRVR